jgi:hypothetical protein
MRYNEYRYLYPPRPATAVAPVTLAAFEGDNWLAQAKMNGTCVTIYVPPNREETFAMGRHGPANRLVWQPGKRWTSFQRHLPGDNWYVFVGELLHSKGVGVRDTVYLFDLLVDNGVYLIGEPYIDRLLRLAQICGAENVLGRAGTHSVILDGVWLARSRLSRFGPWFGELAQQGDKPAVEGLVLKNPQSRLKPCSTAAANSTVGQFKCRLATNSLSF